MRYLLIVFFILLLVGCGAASEPEPEYVPVFAPIATHTAPPPDFIYLDLRFEVREHPLSRNEPTDGIMLGVYAGAMSIADFQAYMGINHAIFAHTMQLGVDDTPLRFLVENIANHSAPLIILTPPPYTDPFNLAPLEDFARDMALFGTPAFVKLYPLTAYSDFEPSEYISFFRTAHVIFAHYAPHVSLTWGFDASELYTASHFFPGDGVVCWIAMTIYNKITPEGYFEGFSHNLQVFHDTFGRTHPLMLQTAATRYCMASNSHISARAAEKIEYIYSTVKTMPRLRAIIYQNRNIQGGDNFQITGSTAVADAYRTATKDPHFIQSMEAGLLPRRDTVTKRSPHKAVSRDFGFYIPAAALHLPGTDPVIINHRAYHPIQTVLQATGGDFHTNALEGTLTLIIE